MPKKQCEFCAKSGHPGYVVSPGGIWQRCPACDGTGVTPPEHLVFTYEIDTVLNANAANVAATAQVNDNDFKWLFAVAVSTGAFTAQVMDGSTKRQFSNLALHQNAAWGTASQPFPLLAPFTFKRRGAIQVALADLSGAQNTVRLSFHGVELIG